MTPEAQAMNFGFLAEVPVGPTREELQQNLLDAWRIRHGVQTLHTTGVEGAWVALHLPSMLEHVKGYSVEPEARESAIVLYFDFCRLFEEAGLCPTADIEHEACALLAKRLGIEFPKL